MSFTVVHNRIRITRGDSGMLILDIIDRFIGEPYVFGSEDRVTLSVKRRDALEDGSVVLIEKTIGRGIDVKENTCVITFVPDDTSELPFGKYWYDVELVRSDGVVDTVITPSLFIVEPEVTSHGRKHAP